jgi:hypothetical protein
VSIRDRNRPFHELGRNNPKPYEVLPDAGTSTCRAQRACKPVGEDGNAISLAGTWKVEFSANAYAKVTEAWDGRIALKAAGLQLKAMVTPTRKEHCSKLFHFIVADSTSRIMEWREKR